MNQQKSKNFFKISIRMRPLLNKIEDNEVWSIDSENNSVTSLNKSSCNKLMEDQANLSEFDPLTYIKRRYADVNYNYHFKFDYVFGKNHNNEEIYKIKCKNIIQNFVNGYNGTIFTYGQTTSGKTYTMLGEINNPGILPFSLLDVFEECENYENQNCFKISISYLEIYNEIINDLLVPNSINLKILDDPKTGVSIQGLKYFEVKNFEDAMMMLKIGEEQRSYGETSFHEHSSRSHTIFQVKLERQNLRANENIISYLNLVDLAGSERIGEDDLKQSEETGFINKSLFVLSNVVHKLAEGKKSLFIPYRDSKLTRILSHSLGGNALTAIICTISPANMNFYQTLSTLRFADRARHVQNKLLFNENKGNYLGDNHDKEKIENLLKEIKNKDDEINKISLENKNLKEEIQESNNKNKYLNDQIICLKNNKKNIKENQIYDNLYDIISNSIENKKINIFFEEKFEQTIQNFKNSNNNQDKNMLNWISNYTKIITNYKEDKTKIEQNYFNKILDFSEIFQKNEEIQNLNQNKIVHKKNLSTKIEKENIKKNEYEFKEDFIFESIIKKFNMLNFRNFENEFAIIQHYENIGKEIQIIYENTRNEMEKIFKSKLKSGKNSESFVDITSLHKKKLLKLEEQFEKANYEIEKKLLDFLHKDQNEKNINVFRTKSKNSFHK